MEGQYLLAYRAKLRLFSTSGWVSTMDMEAGQWLWELFKDDLR